MTNIEKYNQAFVEALGVNELVLTDLKYNGVPSWDSVGHMSLIAAIEEAFDLEFPTDDIIDFSSYKKGIDILRKYKVDI